MIQVLIMVLQFYLVMIITIIAVPIILLISIFHTIFFEKITVREKIHRVFLAFVSFIIIALFVAGVFATFQFAAYVAINAPGFLSDVVFYFMVLAWSAIWVWLKKTFGLEFR